MRVSEMLILFLLFFVLFCFLTFEKWKWKRYFPRNHDCFRFIRNDTYTQTTQKENDEHTVITGPKLRRNTIWNRTNFISTCIGFISKFKWRQKETKKNTIKRIQLAHGKSTNPNIKLIYSTQARTNTHHLYALPQCLCPFTLSFVLCSFAKEIKTNEGIGEIEKAVEREEKSIHIVFLVGKCAICNKLLAPPSPPPQKR